MLCAFLSKGAFRPHLQSSVLALIWSHIVTAKIRSPQQCILRYIPSETLEIFRIGITAEI